MAKPYIDTAPPVRHHEILITANEAFNLDKARKEDELAPPPVPAMPRETLLAEDIAYGQCMSTRTYCIIRWEVRDGSGRLLFLAERSVLVHRSDLHKVEEEAAK